MSSPARAAAMLGAIVVAAGVFAGWPRLETAPYSVAVTRDSAIVCEVRHGHVEKREVTGLSPGAEHSVTMDSGRPASFRTAREPGEGFTFVVIGDSGVTKDIKDAPTPTARQRTLCELMVAARPDFVVHVGDIEYYHSERLEYGDQFFAPYGPLLSRCALFPTPGNHDTRDRYASAYYELFPQGGPTHENRFYSFDWGAVHFVSLDGSDDELPADHPQYAWLERDLAAVPADRGIVIFQHFPIYSSGRHGMFVDSPGVGKRLLPYLRRFGVGLFLCGHDHDYERSHPVEGGTTFVVSGGGGGELNQPSKEHPCGWSIDPPPAWSAARALRYHFTKLAVAPDGRSAALEAIDRDGQVFDRATVALRYSPAAGGAGSSR
ncbi:MAG TPA: metallophosphoesterase [Planctomycetota bacterium]|nr:metallophosphoesterase [Planctomycetota bacterium]